MQGTSFAFLGVAIAGGMGESGRRPAGHGHAVWRQRCCRAGTGRRQPLYRTAEKLFTPIITGSVIALIGISLIKVSIINWSGGEHAKDFASPGNIALGGVTGIIVLLSCAKTG